MNTDTQCQIKILRFNKDISRYPYFQEYMIPFEKHKTIMDALLYIYTHIDGTLAFRASCANGWCNVCLLKVNGKVIKPCSTFMELNMTIEPVPEIPVVRDLIVDRSSKGNAPDRNHITQ